MFEKLTLTAMSQALAAHSGARIGLVAQNLANADTPGFKAKDLISFADVWRAGDPLRATRPGHLSQGQGRAEVERVADLRHGAPNGNTVSVETEMVKAAEARQSHDMALAIYRSTSTIIRSALSGGR